MPRQQQGRPGTEMGVTGIVIPMAYVDAPDQEVRGAKVIIDEREIHVYTQGGDFVRMYESDEDPTFEHGAWLGSLDGIPVVIRKVDRCACKGTQVIPKG